MKYYLAGLFAFALWGFSSLAVKPLSEYPPMDILFARVVLAFSLMLLFTAIFRRGAVRDNFNRFQSQPAGSRRKVILLTVLGGVFLSSNWFFFIYIINHVNVKAASFSYLVCPIVTMLLSRFFLGEKLNKWQWSAVTLSAVGCWLLSLGHWEDLLYSLIVAFSYAAYLVSQRANSGFDSLLMLTLHLAVALVILAFLSPIYVFTLPQNEEFYQYMSILVVVLTILPLSLNLYSLKGISSSSVGMLLYINPLINFLMAIHYFNERVSALQLASYSIIVVSVLVFNKEFILNARPTKLEL